MFLQCLAKNPDALKTRLLKYLLSVFLGIIFINRAYSQTITVTDANSTATNNITASPVRFGQTTIALFGFNVAVTGSATINEFHLTSTNGSSQNYFGNGKLYRSTSNTFNPASPGQQVGSVSFSNGNVDISSVNTSFTNQNYYFYLVADYNGQNGAVPSTIQFKFGSGYNGNSIVVTSPSNYNYNSFTAVSGINYTIADTGISFTDANTSGNGITQGSLRYSQTGIVLFGFGMTITGYTTINEFHLKSSNGNSGNYFGNGKLYRNTSSTFNPASPGTPIGSVSFNGGQVDITGLNQSYSTLTGQTYYYFLVADYNNTNGTAPSTIKFSFDNSISNGVNQSYPTYKNYNTFSTYVAGANFTIADNSLTLSDANTAANGITQGAIQYSQSGIVMFGFGLNVVGLATISEFHLKSTNSSSGNYFGNGKLYRNTTNTFNPASPGTQVGNVAFNGSDIAITNIGQAYTSITTGQTYYYFLVADYNGVNGTVPSTMQISFDTGTANSIVQSSPTNKNYTVPSNITGNNYTIASPAYTITDANTSANGITQGSLRYSQSGIVLFGFGLNVVGSVTVNEFHIKSSNSSSNNYFGNGKLYRNTTNVFDPLNPGTQVGSVAFNGADIAITSIGQVYNSITTGQTYYYFLVADYNNSNGAVPSTIQLSFDTGTGNSIVQTSPTNKSYTVASNTTGTNFTLAATSVVVTNLTGGITSGTLTSGQTGIVLFGFSMAVQGKNTISQININSSNNNLPGYFTNGKLYRSTTNSTFDPANPGTQVGTVTFNGNYANVNSLSESFTSLSSATTYYYFLVADFTVYTGTTPSTVQFNFTSGQSTTAIVQNSPTNINYNSIAVTGTNFTIDGTTITMTSANTTANGITFPTALPLGTHDVVIFGFGVTVKGVFTINNINFGSTAGVSSFFTNVRIYRSTDNVYSSNDTQIANIGTLDAGNKYYSGLNESFSSLTGQTYYYFLVGDFVTSNVNYTQTTAVNFTSGQGGAALIQNSPSKSYNTFNITGQTFSFILQYIWTGNQDQYWNTYNNWKDANNTALNPPPTDGSATVVIPSSVTRDPYTKKSLGTDNDANAINLKSLTIASGRTLHINNNDSFTIQKDITSSGTIVFDYTNYAYGDLHNQDGNATFTLVTGATSSVNNITIAKTSLSKTVTFNGGASFNITGSITPTTGTLVANSNITLKSTATSTASVATINTSNALITGSVNVERWITGGTGTTYRGYRLLSSPVNISNSTTGTGYIDLGYLNNTSNVNGLGALTGGPGGTSKGFSVAITTPAIYVYREDVDPSSSGTNAGKNKGITGIYSTGTTSSVDVATGTTTATSTNFQIPVGNGYIFYNIGSTAQPGNTATTSSPASYAITAKGYLNQGTITFKNWYTKANTLSYTGTLTSNQGFNMVGNPYACTLDLNSFYTDNSAVIQSSIFVLNNINPGQAYISYNASTGLSSDPHASRYIASGQGMFVQAKSASALTFKESQKAAAQQLSGNQLLMGIPAQEASISGFYMKVEQDSLINDYCGIYFDGDSDNFDSNDAVDLDGASPKVYMSSYTADGQRTGINSLSDYKNGKTVKLYVNATTNGLYKLKIEQIKNIDGIYDIWLKDNYKNDSLDLRSNDTYNFNIVRTDAASYGADRFQVIIRKKVLPPYQFVSLTGNMVSSGVNLTWKTQNEYDFTGFTVERLNANKEYDPLYTLQSDGSGIYSFIDKNPTLGINTYRIKQDDIDNKITYSTTVSVNTAQPNSSNSNVVVYPSPATSLINVKFANPLDGPANVIIVNAMGDIVSKQVFTQQQDVMDVSRLKTGVYFLRCTNVNTQKEVGSQRFIKL